MLFDFELFMLFVGDLNNRSLSDSLGKELDLDVIYPDKHIFDDGEMRMRIETPVLDEEVFILKSTSHPVNDNFLELLFTIDALKRSGAKKVTAIIPYLGYSRADHVFREGEAVPLEVVIKSLEANGLDKIILIDPHTIRMSEMFKIPHRMESALPVFAEKIKEILDAGPAASESHSTSSQAAGGQWEPSLRVTRDFSNISIVSPDMGGIRRVRQLSEMIPGSTYAAINKDRDLESGSIESTHVGEGEIREICIVTDDIISTGDTMVKAVELCLKEGAKVVYIFATQPVFANDAHEKLKNCRAERVYVTDAIEVTEEKRFENLEILSLAPQIAKLIK